MARVSKKTIKPEPRLKPKEVVADKTPEPKLPQPQKVTHEGPVCVECGEPVAPGQTYVCVKHQRSN